MGARLRAKDWSATPLGPMDGWSHSLSVAVDLILASPLAMALLWGPDLIQIYNDACAAIFGARHPAALGMPVRECWPEVWAFNAPACEAAFRGEASAFEAQKLALLRDGAPREAWFDLTYSPLRDEAGTVAGVLVTVAEVTSRVRAVAEKASVEAALAESKARLNALANCVPNFVWFATPDGDLHYLNDRWYAYSGQTPAEAAHGGWIAAVHPEDAARIMAAWADARARGVTYEVELRCRRGDGEYRWFIGRAEPLRGAEGRITAWFGTSTDIHDQKLAEAALAESEARFRNMADHAPVMVWTADSDGACTFLSRSWYEFTGQTAQQGLGFGWLEAVHPEDRPEARQVFLQANAHREPFRIDYRLRRADGTWRWAIDAAAPRLGESGEFLGYVGSVIDITDRKRAEQALAESEARLRLAQEAAGAGTWELDFTTGLCRLSPESAHMHELPEGQSGELHETEWAALIHPDDRAMTRAAVARAAAEHGLCDFTYRVPRPDGSVRWIQGLGRAEYGSDGRPRRLVGLNLDATARKQAEERQALLARELDHRAKNTLAVVQAALRLTAKGDAVEYARAVEGRVNALARAHTLLARERWAGAELRPLLEGEFAPFLGPEHRVALDGPRVTLPATAAQAVAMAVHELATNAVKHGALSLPEGRVSVSWRLERGAVPLLRLRWAEANGPAVAGPPVHRGFGTRALDATVRRQLGGVVSLAWNATGLVCEMEIPLARAGWGQDATSGSG